MTEGKYLTNGKKCNNHRDPLREGDERNEVDEMLSEGPVQL